MTVALHGSLHVTSTELRQLLEAVSAGHLSASDAAARFPADTIAELDYATVDLGRAERCGFPEVILAQGKTTEWIAGVARALLEAGQSAFATRLQPEHLAALPELFPLGEFDPLARTLFLPGAAGRLERRGMIKVVTAGTADLPVAQEALVTAHVYGANADLIVDVGVAGLHRVLRRREELRTADVVIVVAGMDGALPSVVGGLVDGPVIAVPTSTGYGAAFGGVAALLTMLNSCAAGVTVVNIDGGFKAGDIAARIVRRIHAASK